VQEILQNVGFEVSLQGAEVPLPGRWRRPGAVTERPRLV